MVSEHMKIFSTSLTTGKRIKKGKKILMYQYTPIKIDEKFYLGREGKKEEIAFKSEMKN